MTNYKWDRRSQRLPLDTVALVTALEAFRSDLEHDTGDAQVHVKAVCDLVVSEPNCTQIRRQLYDRWKQQWFDIVEICKGIREGELRWAKPILAPKLDRCLEMIRRVSWDQQGEWPPYGRSVPEASQTVDSNDQTG